MESVKSSFKTSEGIVLRFCGIRSWDSKRGSPPSSWIPSFANFSTANFAIWVACTTSSPGSISQATFVRLAKAAIGLGSIPQLGIPSCGIEPNPMAAFASRTKVAWEIDPGELVVHATQIAKFAVEKFAKEGIQDEGGLPLFESQERIPQNLKTIPSEVLKLLLTDSISPLPLHKTLVLLETLEENKDLRLAAHEHLALGKSLVNEISNLHFGPEIGVGSIKPDAAVVGPWLRAVKSIAADLRLLQPKINTPAIVHQADARDLVTLLP